HDNPVISCAWRGLNRYVDGCSIYITRVHRDDLIAHRRRKCCVDRSVISSSCLNGLSGRGSKGRKHRTHQLLRRNGHLLVGLGGSSCEGVTACSSCHCARASRSSELAEA